MAFGARDDPGAFTAAQIKPIPLVAAVASNPIKVQVHASWQVPVPQNLDNDQNQCQLPKRIQDGDSE
jgi:hypothetical protein